MQFSISCLVVNKVYFSCAILFVRFLVSYLVLVNLVCICVFVNLCICVFVLQCSLRYCIFGEDNVFVYFSHTMFFTRFRFLSLIAVNLAHICVFVIVFVYLFIFLMQCSLQDFWFSLWLLWTWCIFRKDHASLTSNSDHNRLELCIAHTKQLGHL